MGGQAKNERRQSYRYWVAPHQYHFANIAPDITGELCIHHFSGNFAGTSRCRLEPIKDHKTAIRVLNAIGDSKARRGYLEWRIDMSAPRVITYHVVSTGDAANDGAPSVLFIRRVNVQDVTLLQRYGINLFNRFYERVDDPRDSLPEGLEFADSASSLLEKEPTSLSIGERDIIREALLMGEMTVTQGAALVRYRARKARKSG